jgi:hypothetical protein
LFLYSTIANVAVTDLSEVIVTVHVVLVNESQPLQVVTEFEGLGCAVSVTIVPLL